MTVAGRLWVGGTLLLIAFIAYSSQFFILLPLLEWDVFSPHAVRLLLPFNLLVGMVFWTYYLCVTTDPGGIPKGWEPPPQAEDTTAVEVKKLTGGPRYCRNCRAYKPPRTHHCRQCQRCILKMDHHCPWVNNCVGYHNYGHFIRFLFFVDVACTYHLWLVSKRLFGEFASWGPEPSTREVLFIILNYVTSVPVLLAVGLFSIYHFWCMLGNTTTIEGWEKDKAATLRRRGRIQEFKFPYSLGPLENARTVLGSNILLWCWPRRATGDGLSFRTSADVDESEQYRWPPRDQHTRSTKVRLPAPLPLRPFTYGDALNPDLVPGSGAHLRHRPARSDVSPYHPNYEPAESDGSQDSDSATIATGQADSDEDSDADDDRPLSELADVLRDRLANGGRPEPTQARVRRGSEGYEVRPVLDWDAAAGRADRFDGWEDDEAVRSSDGGEEDEEDGPAWRGEWSD